MAFPLHGEVPVPIHACAAEPPGLDLTLDEAQEAGVSIARSGRTDELGIRREVDAHIH